MPIYGTPQAGSNSNLGKNLTSLIPGESITLFDGTETPATGLKSVAFARGYSPSGDDAGITFNITGMPADMTVDIQIAPNDVDAQYTTIATLAPSTTPDSGNANYTDIGRSAFYRLYLSAVVTLTMPKAYAQR